jgi:glutathione synthase/RimK-type ligase-like ATP-grasp enzyme
MNACRRAPDPHFSNAGSVVRLPWFFVNDTVSAQNCEPDMSAPLSAHRVALITYSGVPSITTDDRLLRDALVARGAEVDARPWDARADWGRYHRIVLRSCWNFHHHPAEFLLWINEVKDNHDGSLRNSPALVQWSVDKRYLLDLDAAGIAIVPTIWVSAPEGEAAPDLDALIAAQGWNEGAVVKPAISATAHQTWLVAPQRASEHQARFEALLASSQSGVMVQPFLPEIREGEWSLIFLGGEFSHAVVKRPVDGDFRVQHDFGGTVERRQPEPSLVEDARAVLHAAARTTGTRLEEILYARVDGILRGGKLLLMELEVIEPTLFFSHAPGAAARMAELIVSK